METYMDKARYLKDIMEGRRVAKGTLKDIVEVLKAFETGDYTKVYKTKLYNEHGGEYCEYLQLINMNPSKLGLKNSLYFYCSSCHVKFNSRGYDDKNMMTCPNCGDRVKGYKL